MPGLCEKETGAPLALAGKARVLGVSRFGAQHSTLSLLSYRALVLSPQSVNGAESSRHASLLPALAS